MRSFDIVLVNIGSLLGFFRWAVLILLVVLSFYLINKEKKIWKANLGIISLIFTVFLTPLLILEIIWKGPIEDDIAVIPNTSVENITENPFSGVKPESPQNVAPSSGGVPSSHKNSSATDDGSSIAPVPEPTPTHHVVDVENATIENPSEDGKYEKGTLIRITANDKAGYYFDKWFSNDNDIKDKTDNPLEFDMPDGDLTIYPVYAPNTDTPYTVIHEKMNISGVYEEAETEHLTGTTDTNVTPATRSYEGFATPDTQTKPISGDGLMSITYQYKRNKYNFVIEHSDYIVEGDVSGEYYFEKSITVTAKDREDYNFVKWVNQDNQDVSMDASYTFNMPANDLTLYPVYEYVDPFPDSWSQIGKCIFEAYKDGNNKAHGLVKGDECAEYSTANTGLEYIDTGLSLYNAENIDKDFEISFTIDHFAFDEQLAKNQETIFSAKEHDWGSGAQLRLLTTNDKLELIHRKDDDEHQGREAVVLPIVDGQRITMMRYNGDFYYKVDNSAYVLMQENASEIMEGSFDLTAWIGAAPANADGSEQRRFITGELSNIVLKLGENKTADFYEVTFAPNGGSLSYKLYYVQKGDAIGPLPTPTRSGYAFTGWFDSDGQEIISSTVPNGDITYTAHWVKDITQAKLADSQMDLVVGEVSQQIRITNLNEIEPISFSSNDESVATVDPETGLVTAVGAGETDIVITGYYSGITRTVHINSFSRRYTVTFNADGGSSVESMNVLPGSKINPIPSTTKEDHTFLGWFTERFGGGEELDSETTINDDVTYWAYWDEGSSDVVLVCKKATDLHTETCLRDSNDGCRAAGYSKNDTITYGTLPGTSVPQFGNAYNCDVNYDNKYDSVSERFYYLGQNGDNAVLVSHTNFEGSAGQKTTTIYSYNDALTMLPTTAQWSNPYLENFDGKPARFLTRAEVQTDCSNLNNCQFLIENTSFHINDKTVSRTALWLQKVGNTLYRIHSVDRKIASPASDSNNAARPTIEVPMEYVQVGEDVIVTFDYRDGRDNYERTLGPSEIVGELPHVENKEHAEFAGWFTAPDGGDQIDKYTVPSGNVTYYAHWNIDKYTVTFMSEGSQFSELTNVEHGSKISAPDPAPTKEGYTFTGWRKSGESSDWDFANDTITGNTTLEAQFESGSVEPTYVCKLAEESTLTTFTCPSGQGCSKYHSVGSQVTFGQVAQSIIPALGDAYDCDVNNNGLYNDSSETETERFYYMGKNGDNAVLVSSDSYEGQDGQAHAASVNYDPAWNNLPTAGENGQWSNPNLVTFDGDHAARFLARSEFNDFCKGTDAANALELCNFMMQNSAYDGAGRSGIWFEAEGSTTAYRIHTSSLEIQSKTKTNSTNMARPVIEVPYELIETLPPVPVNISFDANGGVITEGDSSKNINSGDPIGALPVASRSNYRFFGWYTDADYHTEVTTNTVADSDTTYYARWVEDIPEFPIEFYQTDACVFDAGVVSGDLCNYRTEDTNKQYIDTGIALYSNENLGNDFEIGFTIVSYNASDSATQSPFVNAKGENTSGWPGFVVRKNNSGAEFTSRWNGTAATAISFTPSDGTRVLIRKVDDDVWVSVNDGEPQLLQNYSAAPTVLVNDIIVWFGASNKSGEPRYLSATLTDIYIKIGDYSDGTELTVTFDGNGGTPSETQVNVNSGEQIQNIPSVSRLNHHFDGWYDDPTDGNLVSDGITPITPSSNDTYYAHWTYNQSSEIVEHYSSNDAVREYFAKIDTWSVDETTLWSSLKGNFEDHKCMGPDKNDVSTDFGYTYNTTGAEEYCDKDIPFDTGFASANVYLSDESTKAKGSQVVYTNSSAGKIYNMIPGQVYYYEDANDSSKYGYVKAVNERRIMTVGTIRNVRDLGGWSVSGTNTLDGSSYTGKINYEYLFRGAELLVGKGNAAALLNAGVTKQYELRDGTQYESEDKMANYAHTGLYNYDFATDNFTRYEMARTAVTGIMEDVAYNDEKVYFHCTHGADRTGSVAYLLEGLLGVSEEDRNREYELTTFSGQADRTRFYDHKGTNPTCGSGLFDPCKKYIYMQSYVRTNQEIYNWYTHNRTGADLDYDNQLIQDFRDKVLTYN